MPHVVITGASRGPGRAMVPEFLQRGWTVSGCGRSPDAMAALQSECDEPNSFLAVDVASDESVADWADHVIAQNGAEGHGSYSRTGVSTSRDQRCHR